MVEMNVVLKVSSENLKRMHVLPTPESPISRSLNSRSYLLAMVAGWPLVAEWLNSVEVQRVLNSASLGFGSKFGGSHKLDESQDEFSDSMSLKAISKLGESRIR